MPLRTRTRDPEAVEMRTTGKDIWTRTNLINPSRNKVVEGIIRHACTASGLRFEVTTDELHGRPPFQTGGPFFNVKLWYPDFAVSGYSLKAKPVTQPTSTTGAFLPGDTWERRYDGALLLASGSALMSSSLGAKESIRKSTDLDPVVNPDDLSSLGPTGWNKLRPKLEKAGIGQSLAEITSAPRMLKASAASALKAWNGLKAFHQSTKYVNQRKNLGRIGDLRRLPKPVADEFLNVVFGWRPFVKDVIAALDVALNLEDHIQNTTKRNNAWQQRRWDEEVVTSSLLVHSEGGLATSRIAPLSSGDTWFKPWTSNYLVYRESWAQVSYAGSFKFYRGEFDKEVPTNWPAVRKARQTISLLGGNITPTLLWEVTPFSWLADWFGNLGENIQALEDQLTGQVAAKYMYVMRHAYDQYRYVASSTSQGGNVVTVEAQRRLSVKARVQSAGHFEFSLKPGPLSGFQMSILAALGISKR